MTLPNAGLLTRFTRRETEQLFKQIQVRVKKLGLEILLAPRSLQFGRCLISISKKAGNAPQRNRLRRRIKAIFYTMRLFQTPFDWVVIARSPATTQLNFNQLHSLLTDISHAQSPNSAI